MSDAPGWVGAIAGCLSAAAALGNLWWTNHRSQQTHDELGEQLNEEKRQRESMAQSTERIAAALEGRTSSTTVDWQAENPKKNTFVVRNLGGETATGVTIDEDRLNAVRVGITPDLPADVAPGGSIELVVVSSMQKGPIANEVWVRCDQLPEPVAVPLPRWF